MSNPNRIRDIRESRGMTIEHLAELTDLSVSYISRLEKGERELSVKNLRKVAAAFNVPERDILHGADEPLNIVKVMGYVGAGAEILPEFEQVPPEGLDQIELPFAVPDDVIALGVRGDSMLPVYSDGDAIIVWRDQKFPTDSYVGEEAAVRTRDGRRFLKRILRGERRGIYDLESFNARSIAGVGIEWVGEIYLTVKLGQINRIRARNRAAATKRLRALEAETSGMNELPLAKKTQG